MQFVQRWFVGALTGSSRTPGTPFYGGAGPVAQINVGSIPEGEIGVWMKVKVARAKLGVS